MIRVLVVDDHDFVRAMVSQALSAARGIEVVGECQDGTAVVSAAASLHPDIVLMDVQMPGMSGIEATRDLTAVCPLVRVLMLTGAVTSRFVTESADAGASGYLVKSGDSKVLVSAVRTVASGGSIWP
ncbi:MAG: response regulator transcription factor [Nakamurella sp.]